MEKTKDCILIVDDQPSQLRVLSHILMPHYDVKMAKDGYEALEIAEEGGVDLILLDVVMPGKSGFEVLTELKKNEKTKSLPVIFISGENSSEAEVKGLSLGAADYITKPFSEAVVRLRIALHLQLKSQMRIIERFGLTDGLTGAGNRRNFDIETRYEWDKARRECTHFSMLMLDIDFFKSVNDKYGHLNGDICLQTVARVLMNHSPSGMVFRWGGEEFAVVLPHYAHEETKSLAEEIRIAIENTPVYCGEYILNITASLGYSTIIPDIGGEGLSFEEFCQSVDDALYAAKRNGRNRTESALIRSE